MKSFQGMTDDELTLMRGDLILDIENLRTEIDRLDHKILEVEAEMRRRKRKEGNELAYIFGGEE